MVHIQDVQEVRFVPILLLIFQEKIMKKVHRHFLRTNAYFAEQVFLSEGGKTRVAVGYLGYQKEKTA